MTAPTTLAQLIALVRQLKEDDRVTVLKFAQAVFKDQAGKQSQRRKSYAARAGPVDHWQIGAALMRPHAPNATVQLNHKRVIEP